MDKHKIAPVGRTKIFSDWCANLRASGTKLDVAVTINGALRNVMTSHAKAVVVRLAEVRLRRSGKRTRVPETALRP